MACYSVQKYGFTTISEMMTDIISEMTTTLGALVSAPHFVEGVTYTIVDVGADPTDFTNAADPLYAADNVTGTVFTMGATPLTGNGTATILKDAPYFDVKFGTPGITGAVILESTDAVDPMSNVASTFGGANSTITGAWRLCFNQLSEVELAVHAGTALQLKDDGTIAYLNNRGLATQILKEPAGNIGADWTGTAGIPLASDANQIWLNRHPDIGSESAYPMSYALTITNRGVFLGVWQDSQEEIPQSTPGIPEVVTGAYGRSPFRWFLIQRPVDSITGHVRGGVSTAEISRCPVYCVSGTGVPTDYRKFVVREVDVVSPSQKKYAAVPSEDTTALLNPFPQQSLTEGGEFVVTFINNLTTSRYKYADELDMLGTVSAEVIGAGTGIDVTVYNEAETRTYTAVYANQQYGTGMRLMLLTACSKGIEDSHLV